MVQLDLEFIDRWSLDQYFKNHVPHDPVQAVWPWREVAAAIPARQ
jgi:hypothetical protein